jgi:hypothetical protein
MLVWKNSIFVGAALALCLAATGARAQLVFQVDTVFNGSTPASTPPWLTATFNTVVTGQVQLVLESHLNVASEFIDEVTFNVDPSIVPSDLSIAQDPVANPVITSISNTTDNAQNLTGGGGAGHGFDVKLDWGSAAGVGRFNDSDVVTLTITGTGITEDSFNFTNSGGADAHVGAHIQGIPGTAGTISGAVKDSSGGQPPSSVPEPGTWAQLAGIGLSAGLLGLRRLHRA